MLLDYLVEDNDIDLNVRDVKFIKDLIQGEPRLTRCVFSTWIWCGGGGGV